MHPKAGPALRKFYTYYVSQQPTSLRCAVSLMGFAANNTALSTWDDIQSFPRWSNTIAWFRLNVLDHV
jgi:hypothetical protein